METSWEQSRAHGRTAVPIALSGARAQGVTAVGARGAGVSHRSQGGASTPQAEARTQLRRLGLRAVKGLGQHFLVDSGVLSTIVDASELKAGDTIVEVGPGLGVLTAELIRTARKVVAVEIDANLAAALERRFSDTPQLTVLNADILDLEPAELLGSEGPTTGAMHAYKVAANLPYSVGSPILRHFLESECKPTIMVVMLQKEVAQRMVAGPGHMSLLGVGVQLYGRPRIIDYVPARCFYPEPKVDSAIVRIDVYPRPALGVGDIAGFFEVVKAGFSAPRKQLRNSLTLGLDLTPPEAECLLHDAGIAAKRRPQTLSLEEWAQLHEAFANRR